MNMIDAVVNTIGNPKSAKVLMLGWISPEGEFMQVDMYSHFPELKKRGLYPELFYQLKEAVDNELEDQQNFLESCGEDDHIPWHCYYSDWETARDNVRLKIIERAYQDGWVRIGFNKRTTVNNVKRHNVLELEGTLKRLNELKKDAEFLAETYSSELFLTNR